MNHGYIVELKNTTSGEASLVGGKALNLSKLINAGFVVPNGFCVTTRAYLDFVTQNGLDDIIATSLGDIDFDNQDEVEQGSKFIQGKFSSSELSVNVALDVQAAYTLLGQPIVAVRSSATSEDSSSSSFAGQQESYLNVTGLDEVLKFIKSCWMSLWSARSILYRVHQNIGYDQTHMAVVVQNMIQADIAGVLFTRNPLNGNSNEIVINSSFGLGEAVVSGQVTPDMYIIDKQSRGVIQSNISSKEVMTVANTDGGIKSVEIEDERRKFSSLSQTQLIELCDLAIRVEMFFHSPQDIEWAYSNGDLTVLQSRPITTQQQKQERRDHRRGVLSRVTLNLLLDYFPIPPYHFDRSVLLSLVDTTLQLWSIFGFVPPPAQDVLKAEDDGAITLNPKLPRITWKTPFGIIAGLRKLWYSFRINPLIWVERQWPIVEQSVRELQEIDVQGADNFNLVSNIHRCIRIRDKEIFEKRFDYFFGGFVTIGMLPIVLKLVAGKEGSDLYYRLMSGLNHPTAQMNRQLQELTQFAFSSRFVHDTLAEGGAQYAWTVLETNEEGRAFLLAVEKFLERFGVRTSALIPMPSESTWAENPSIVLDLVATMLRTPVTEKTGHLEQQQQEAAKAYTRALELGKRLPGLRQLLGFLIPYSQAMVVERDWIIFAYESVNQPVRQYMLEIGKRLRASGVINDSDDIRFLTLMEVSDLLRASPTEELVKKMHAAVRLRKIARAKTLHNWTSQETVRANSTDGPLLKGIGGSAGVTTGTAKVILSERMFSRLNPGDILVCRSTNPSWTPLFAIASGVVADNGGPLSHAAIVAREYGIPAVLGTMYATSTMKDGERYTIDGREGKVWRSESYLSR